MIVVFGRSRTLASFAIRLFTWSRWSHVGILDGDNVIEATSRKGVAVTTLEAFMSRYHSTQVAEVPSVDGWCDRLLECIGDGYDWRGIFSLVFRSKWDDRGKWFCSELVAYASGMFRHGRVSRVTPEHIWMISKDA